MDIRIESPPGPEIIKLLQVHHADMLRHSPVESVHALDLVGMQALNLCFWGAWQGQQLAACGALKQLNSIEGEVKSMRTATDFLRKGCAKQLLDEIIAGAVSRGYQRLYLETGTSDGFNPARQLYFRSGFVQCEAFSGYKADPASVFMCKSLR